MSFKYDLNYTNWRRYAAKEKCVSVSVPHNTSGNNCVSAGFSQVDFNLLNKLCAKPRCLLALAIRGCYALMVRVATFRVTALFIGVSRKNIMNCRACCENPAGTELTETPIGRYAAKEKCVGVSVPHNTAGNNTLTSAIQKK